MERARAAPADDSGPGRSATRSDPDWHAMAPSEVAAALDVDPERGLDADAVRERLDRHGPNRLPEGKQRSLLRLFLEQFRSLIIAILAVAAVLAWVIGETADAVVIGVVLLLNGVLGFVQEYRAEQSLQALERMLVPTATVRRDGRTETIESADLVPGDVVLLGAGDRVPADGRLLTAASLEIDESALTGESTPVAKTTEALDAEADLALADRVNSAFMNTVVTRGRGRLLVTATGPATEMGGLAEQLGQAEEGQTPLGRQLDQLGRRLSGVAGIAVVLVIGLGLARGEPLGEMVLTGIALAVAAIPEGLPAVVTVTLALGLSAMSRRGAIVKRLPSAETLGSTTVICTDKTGTLTLNEMTARAVLYRGVRYRVSGEGYGDDGEIAPDGRVDGGAGAADGAAGHPGGAPGDDLEPVLFALALCNDSDLRDGELVGDPTEGGLLALARKGGVDPDAARRAAPRIAEVPFDSAAKYMATAHETGDGVWLYVKGAPRVVVDRSATVVTEHGSDELSDAVRQDLGDAIGQLTDEGLRVLAVARRRIEPQDATDRNLPDRVERLELLGLVGLLDPPRSEVRDAIRVCQTAGVRVKMITGDHAGTAAAIASSLGISGEAVTGSDLDGMTDDELRDRVEGIGVFARVAPEHKVRVVQALAANGEVTAMTGDGVNDAPALRNADIGIAMGQTGTEVAQEAADMVLTDDNFATIVAAVEEGRRIFDDIVAFVRFQLSTNVGAIVLLVTAPLLGMPLPLSPIQVLFVNLLADGPPAMALGVDPAGPDAMRRPPRRPRAPILDRRRIARVLWFGGIMAVGTLTVFAWALAAGDREEARTLAFATFVLYQCANAFNARTEDRSVIGRELFANRWLWLALVGVVVVLALAVHVPALQTVFGTAPIPGGWWVIAAGAASSILVAEEARKLAARLLGVRRTAA